VESHLLQKAQKVAHPSQPRSILSFLARAGVNLTNEQRELLRELVAHYDEGHKGEFLFSPTMDSPLLVYVTTGLGASPGGAVPCNFGDELNFQALAAEQLITLTQRGSNLVGKPTALGIQIVHEGVLDEVVDKSLSRAINRETGRIFIGHGHSLIWLKLRDFLEKRLDLTTDEFNREPAAGFSTQEILERMLNEAAFAFLVMTGEDPAADGTIRARENVIHEIGLFQGRLGMCRAIVMLEERCTSFSNIHGLTTIPFPTGDIMAASEEVRRVLEREEIVKP